MCNKIVEYQPIVIISQIFAFIFIRETLQPNCNPPPLARPVKHCGKVFRLHEKASAHELPTISPYNFAEAQAPFSPAGFEDVIVIIYLRDFSWETYARLSGSDANIRDFETE